MNVCLKTLGCRLNEAELEYWAGDFQKAGHCVVDAADHADLIVINTCAVTNEATRKSRQLIRRSHRNNPRAKLVVSGCYGSLEAETVQNMAGIDLLVPNSRKDELVDLVHAELEDVTMPAVATEPAEPALFTRGRNRAFIKVQDGCRYRCTFCIVTVARGEEHSRPMADIIDEINRLHAQGVQEAVLTGVHVGGYGSDTGSSLHELITAVLAETDIPRLRLGSVEPWDLGDEFFRLFANPRMMPHLHLPLQSGSDTVLKRMARRCRTADFRRLIATARGTVLGFNVTTDIIVGFPGETEEEWRESLVFIEDMGFSHIHIFSYSERPGTAAAAMPGPVDIETRKQRSRELHGLMRRMKRQFAEGHKGRDVEVLIETTTIDEASGRYSSYGYTPNYLRVRIDGDDPLLFNRICAVKTSGYDEEEESLIGIVRNEE